MIKDLIEFVLDRVVLPVCVVAGLVGLWAWGATEGMQYATKQMVSFHANAANEQLAEALRKDRERVFDEFRACVRSGECVMKTGTIDQRTLNDLMIRSER